MNRRSFLASAAAIATAALVPSWLVPQKRRIDLRPFCGYYGRIHGDMNKPFAQEVNRLDWSHDQQHGWQPWPDESYEYSEHDQLRAPVMRT